MLRVRCCDPVPHVSVHVDHDPHSNISQSTGHGWVLQLRFSTRGLHGRPPNAVCVTTLRDRDCWPPGGAFWLLPPPAAVHDTVHAVQALKLDSTQSMGHGCVLHACVSSVCAQGWPPFSACVTTVRERA